MNSFCKMSQKHPPYYYLMTNWKSLNAEGKASNNQKHGGEKKALWLTINSFFDFFFNNRIFFILSSYNKTKRNKFYPGL